MNDANPKRKWIFIIGAPKCGTTSIADWLGRHPDVVQATAKEPGYFRSGERLWVIDANHPDRRSPAKNAYMSEFGAYDSLFGDAGSEKWRLDPSTDYFSDPGATAAIKALTENDRVKLICILRDPIDRMRSEYYHTLRDQIEPLSFRDALLAEKDRQVRSFQPLFCHADRSKYAKHIDRWRAAFGEDLLLLDFHTLNETEMLKPKLLNFLGLDSQNIGPIEKLNSSTNRVELQREIRFYWLRQITKRLLVAAKLRAPDTHIHYPEITEDDRRFALDFLKDDIEDCLRDPDIPTDNWPNRALIEAT